MSEENGGGLPAENVERAPYEGAGEWVTELSHAPGCEDPVDAAEKYSLLAQPAHCSHLSFRRHSQEVNIGVGVCVRS